MNLKTKSTILIEKYLDGTLKGDKLRDFEEQLKSNDELRKRVILHKEVNESIEIEDVTNFREKLKHIYSIFRKWENAENDDSPVVELQNNKTGFFIKHRTLIAASIAFLIVAGALVIYIIKTGISNGDELFSMYYQTYKPDIHIRSDVDKISELAKAILIYDQNDYKAAFEKLNAIIEDDHENYLAKYYFGMTCIEMDKYDLAIQHFQDIMETWQSPFIYHTEWYLALCYIKQDDREKAVILLNKIKRTNNYYKDKAEELLKKLD